MAPVVQEPEEEASPISSFTPRSCSNIDPRHTLCMLVCLGLAIGGCQRANLSVAIVAMVKPIGNITVNTTFCPSNPSNSSMTVESEEDGMEFSWDKWTQGIVLGAFYWGFATTNLLGGRASEYLGGKTMMGLGIIASSFLSLITPMSARASVPIIIMCRIFLGAAQGIIYPAINTILAAWFLPLERGKYTTIAFSGLQVGILTGLTVSGWLADSSLLGGWPAVFYCFGATGIPWVMAWCVLVHNRPEDHPGMTYEALTLLQDNRNSVKQAETVAIPWKSLSLSLPFWGIMMAALGNEYGFSTLLNEMPTYMNDVQHFSLTSNGLLCALPFLLMLLWSLAWAALMNFLSQRDLLSIVSVRRLSMFTGLYGPMAALLVLVFVQCNTLVAVSMICVAGMLNGGISSGFLCSHQDISPNLAGTLLGLTNTVGAIAGIASPAVSSYIVEEIKPEWAWRIAFLITVVLYFFTCTFYIVVISAKVQPWNEPPGFQGVCVGQSCRQHHSTVHDYITDQVEFCPKIPVRPAT